MSSPLSSKLASLLHQTELEEFLLRVVADNGQERNGQEMMEAYNQESIIPFVERDSEYFQVLNTWCESILLHSVRKGDNKISMLSAPSGSGKTHFLNMLCWLASNKWNRVEIGGTPAEERRWNLEERLTSLSSRPDHSRVDRELRPALQSVHAMFLSMNESTTLHSPEGTL